MPVSVDDLALSDGDLGHRGFQISRKVTEQQAGEHDIQILPEKHMSANL
jgi:hypothetical protein